MNNLIKETSQLIRVPISLLQVHKTSKTIYGERKTSKTIKELAENIKLVGQLEPIIVNQNNIILSGVRRYYSCLFLRKNDVMAIIVNSLDPEKEVEFIVSSNKQRIKTARQIVNEAEAILGTLGKNQGKRSDLLKSDESNPYGNIGKNRFKIAASVIGNDTNESQLRRLLKISDFDKEEGNKKLGLLDKVVKKELSVYRATVLIKDINKQKEDKIKYEVSKASKKSVTIKDEQSLFKIFNSSSSNMKEVETGSVQVVITSPPYWNIRNYGNSVEGKRELGLERTVQEFIIALSEHFRDVKRVLKDTGSFFINIGDTYRTGANNLVPVRLLLNLCDNEGWFLVNEIIWKKSGGIPQGETKRLQPIYEKIFHLVKNPDTYYYEEFKNWKDDKEISLVKFKGNRNTNSTKLNSGGIGISKGYDRFRDFLDDQNVKNVIMGSTAANRQNELKKLDISIDHPALMPTYLPIVPILTTSKEGDIVLDPFSGSGTTGKAALIFGRKYIGYEINEEFYNLSIRDLNNTLNQTEIKGLSENDEDGWI